MLKSNPSEPASLGRLWSVPLRLQLIIEGWLFVLFFSILVIFYNLDNFYIFENVPFLIKSSDSLFQSDSFTMNISNCTTYVYPAYPFYLKTMNFLFFGSKWTALPVSCLLQALLAVFAFYFFLHYAKFTKRNDIVIALFSLIPLGFQLYMFTVNDTALFFIEVCFFFGFLFKGAAAKASIFACLCVLTQKEGLFVVIVFFLDMVRTKKLRNILIGCSPLLSVLLLMAFHLYKYNDEFILFSDFYQNFRVIPFNSLYVYFIRNPVELFTVISDFYLVPFLSSLMIYYKKSFSLFAYHICYLIYLIFFNTSSFQNMLGVIVAIGSPLGITMKFDEHDISTKPLRKILLVVRIILICLFAGHVSNKSAGTLTIDKIMQ